MINNNRIKVYVLKYALYTFLFMIFAVWQSTIGLFEIFGVRPITIVPCVIAIAMFDGELIGGIFGAIGGVFCDGVLGYMVGYNGIFLLVMGTLIGLLVIYYVQNNLKTAIYFCSVVILIKGLLEWSLGYVIWGYGDNLFMLLQGTLPWCLYTIMVTPIFYILFKHLHLFFESKINR